MRGQNVTIDGIRTSGGRRTDTKAGVLTLAAATVVGLLGVSARVAHADVAAIDGEEQQKAVEGKDDDATVGAEFGIGVRIRNVRVPKGVIELFVESAPGSMSEVGVGLELTRRRGNTELQLGFEWDPISVQKGIWVQKGQSIATDEVDLVNFDDFNGWLTAEATFMHHTPLNSMLSLRYGAGGGIGLLLGDVHYIDKRCTSEDIETCQDTDGGTVKAYDLHTPVFPVLNLIGGLQFKPTDKMTINLEFGLRTLPFLGVSSTYYF